MASSTPPIDTTTVLSLLTTLFILLTAYALSLRLLPRASTPTARVLFIWHAFDALIHFLLEGSYLYNCFFSYKYLSPFATQNYILTPPGVFFGGEKYRDRLYGSLYGTNPASALWREYAKADRRWGGADLTVISLELLTVFGGGPLAVYVCSLLARGYGESGRGKGRVGGKVAFWMSVLATGELYGGFMTFAPEWLSGNSSLDGSNWMYL